MVMVVNNSCVYVIGLSQGFGPEANQRNCKMGTTKLTIFPCGGI